MNFKIAISKIVGDYAEMYISHYLIKKGWNVFKNQTSDGVDLIANKNILITIQVKASTLMNISPTYKGYCFQIRRKRSKETYTVDYLACCCVDSDTLNIDKVYFIPFDKIKNYRGNTLNIKFGKTKWDKYLSFN